MTWQEQYMKQLFQTLSPFLTVPNLPYNCTKHDLTRLRSRAKASDDIADALRRTSARIKTLINTGASPIFRLPNEILSEIMLWACDIPELTHFRPLKYQRFGRHLSPLVLGQVCHQWRKVSQADSRLWTFLWVDLTFETCEKDVRRVEHWFRMAKELPLVVNITHNDDTRLVDEVDCEKLLPDWQPCRQVLRALFSHSDRIGSLFFGILDGGWGDLLRTPMNFAKLRHLSINGDLDPVFTSNEVLMFSNAPRLESVDLWAVDPASLHLPWDRISNLRICWTKLDDLVNILRRCPNLGCLQIRNVESSTDDEEDNTMFTQQDQVTLPNLHTLDVTEDSTNEGILSLFQTLHCPSVVNLKYNTFGPRTYSTSILPWLIPFLKRSDKLSSLDASGILFHRDDLKCLLCSVPTLHHLVLDVSKAWETVPDSTATHLVQLFHRANDVLPKLRHLELEADLKLSFDVLFAVLETRCPDPFSYCYNDTSSADGGCWLESVGVNIHAPAGHVAPAEWKPWLDSLCQRGLPVRLNVPFAKTSIPFALATTPASRMHMFSFADVI